jgi:hypothetical protein
MMAGELRVRKLVGSTLSAVIWYVSVAVIVDSHGGMTCVVVFT